MQKEQALIKLFNSWNVTDVDIHLLKHKSLSFNYGDIIISVKLVDSKFVFYSEILALQDNNLETLFFGASLNSCFELFTYGILGINSKNMFVLFYCIDNIETYTVFENQILGFVQDIIFCTESFKTIQK